MSIQLSTPVSAGTQSPITPEQFQNKLDQLAEKWKARHEADLQIRHEAGVLLNERFGSPAKRQERGARVLEEAAEKLQTTASELSRMRWFAHHFSTLDDLREEHKDVTTWTAVKALLPALRQQGKRQARSGTAKSRKDQGRKARKLIAIKKSLGSLSSKLKQFPEKLTDDQRKDLLAKFRSVAQVFAQHLEVTLEMGDLPAAPVPSPATVRLAKNAA